MASILDFLTGAPLPQRPPRSVSGYYGDLQDALDDAVIEEPVVQNPGGPGRGRPMPAGPRRVTRPGAVRRDPRYAPLDPPPSGTESDDAPETTEGGVPTVRRPGRRPEECAWCTYGKPAALGAAAGAALGYLSGWDLARTALWGAGAGLAYGWMWGDPFPSAPAAPARAPRRSSATEE